MIDRYIHHQFITAPDNSRLYVNTGTNPLENTNEGLANKNIEQLIEDVGLDGVTAKRNKDRDFGKGRFAYVLTYELNKRNIEVQMPGLSLERVRYTQESQCACEFPRLYVNGGSWLWKFAVNLIKSTFENNDLEEQK